jgi:hypothetical protein
VVVAELALVAEIDDLANLFARELRGLLLVPIDRTEQRRKRRTEGEAAAAIMAVLEYPLELSVESRGIEKLGIRQASVLHSCSLD